MNPYLKNIIIFFVAVIVLALFFGNNISKEEAKSSGNDVVKLNPQMSEFLKNESIYRTVFSKNKNVVFYGEECSCPYSQGFNSRLSELIKTGKYNKNYKFEILSNDRMLITMKDKDYKELLDLKQNKPEEYNRYYEASGVDIDEVLPESKGKFIKEFYDKCDTFCIVNSDATKMVKFGGVGKKEIANLEEILDKYNNKDW